MEPNINDKDIETLEKELKSTNEVVSKMTENRMNLNA